MQVNRTKWLFLIVFVLLAGGAAALWIRSWLHGSGQPVQIGDTKSTVLAKLGEPAVMFTNYFVLLKYGGEVWAYGRVFDPKAALAGDLPFKLRVLGPDEDDYVVIFDASNTVKSLQAPKK